MILYKVTDSLTKSVEILKRNELATKVNEIKIYSVLKHRENLKSFQYTHWFIEKIRVPDPVAREKKGYLKDVKYMYFIKDILTKEIDANHSCKSLCDVYGLKVNNIHQVLYHKTLYYIDGYVIWKKDIKSILDLSKYMKSHSRKYMVAPSCLEEITAHKTNCLKCGYPVLFHNNKGICFKCKEKHEVHKEFKFYQQKYRR